MPAVMQVFIAVIIISAIVGAVAQMLSKMSAQNNNNNQPNRRPNPERNRGGGSAVRQSNSDVDRFLAEIDRLRQRTELPTAQPASRPAARPGRQRPVAEPVRPPARTEAQSESAYTQPPSPILSPDKPSRTEELPQVSSLPQAAPPPLPAISHSLPPIPTMPANPVTPRAVLARKRAAPRTEFAAQLTTLLGTKGGLPMAIVLTEILGKPKSRPM